MEKKKLLTGHQIDVIRRAILYLIARDGEARLVILAAYLLTLKEKGFTSEDWCGYKKFIHIIEAYPDFFEIYGDSLTNKAVRIVPDLNCSTSDSTQFDIDTNPEIFLRRNISRDFHKTICSDFNLGDGLEDYCIFINFLKFYFLISLSQGKVLKSENLRLFHTGWFRDNTDPIFLLMGYDRNNRPHMLFLLRSGREARNVIRLFDNRQPELVELPRMDFDSGRHTEVEYGHILYERADRLPKETIEMLRHSPNMPEDSRDLPEAEIVRICRNYLRRLLSGCIQDTQMRLRNRRDEAVQFWYKRTNKMCWLIPLRLGISDEANLALVLEPSELNEIKVYRAHTILPLKEAFKCARLLGPVRADWLRDTWKNNNL